MWPIETSSPRVVGTPSSAWMTLPSCTFVRRPMRSSALSPRRIAPNQTLASSASSTSPTTVALSATQALA